MSIVEFISGVIFVVILYIALRSIYKLGYSDGKHVERMHLLNILSRIPPLPELVYNSSSEYDVRYSALYVVDYVIHKMRGRSRR